MRRTSCTLLALAAAILMVTGCNQEKVAEKHHPAKIEETAEKGIMKITLEPKAAERLGVETTTLAMQPVTLQGRSETRLVMPYGALMYDTKGGTWTFTNPEPLVFIRKSVTVEGIEGDRVILSDGPPAGTVIVTVGAAELMGAEHKYGH